MSTNFCKNCGDNIVAESGLMVTVASRPTSNQLNNNTLNLLDLRVKKRGRARRWSSGDDGNVEKCPPHHSSTNKQDTLSLIEQNTRGCDEFFEFVNENADYERHLRNPSETVDTGSSQHPQVIVSDHSTDQVEAMGNLSVCDDEVLDYKIGDGDVAEDYLQMILTYKDQNRRFSTCSSCSSVSAEDGYDSPCSSWCDTDDSSRSEKSYPIEKVCLQ